jgi:type IV secretory pathway VirB6-like protein
VDPSNAPVAFQAVLQHVLMRALQLQHATADQSTESHDEDEVLACLGEDPLVVTYTCLLARLLITNSQVTICVIIIIIITIIIIFITTIIIILIITMQAGIALLEKQANPQQTLKEVTALGTRWKASLSRSQVGW